jgi:polysaccharide deacetylase family protein (PEP-CTERM system associated)
MTTPLPASTSTPHFFTVDVEEYFQVSAFERHVARADWERLPSRVVASTEALLDLLDSHGATGTFFTLGWVARRHAALVREIARRGHEVASHGYLHQRVTALAPDAFRADVREAKDALEQVAGTAVVGYRAPSFSIVPGREWALEILVEEGHRYDSSLFPISRAGYGYPSAPTVPHVQATAAGPLIELPPATTQLLGRRVAAAGGGWLRQLPLALVQRAFRENTRAGTPAMFYIHPWEVDPSQPRLAVPLLTRVRHYRGLAATMGRLATLLREFPFTAVAPRLDALAEALGVPERLPVEVGS